jgi:hypothetical protein
MYEVSMKWKVRSFDTFVDSVKKKDWMYAISERKLPWQMQNGQHYSGTLHPVCILLLIKVPRVTTGRTKRMVRYFYFR